MSWITKIGAVVTAVWGIAVLFAMFWLEIGWNARRGHLELGEALLFFAIFWFIPAVIAWCIYLKVAGYFFHGLAICMLAGFGAMFFMESIGDIVRERGSPRDGLAGGFCLAAAWLLYRKWWGRAAGLR